MGLFAAVAQTLGPLGPAVYASRPDLLAAATGDGAGLRLRERRALRKQARSLPGASAEQSRAQLSREELGAALAEAARQLAEWQDLRTDSGLPRLPSGFRELQKLTAECEQQRAAPRAYVRIPADPEPLLAALSEDQDTAWKLPRLYELGARFDEIGLGPLLDELARRGADPNQASAAFDHAWYSSILDQIRVRDPRYAAHHGAALDEIASDFRAHDVQHLVANRLRVRRAWADRLRAAQDHHPLQARVIRKQAALRRGHLPLRRLLDQVSDLLFALK